MLSLTKAFEARNERLRNDEKGFTLIELLVVVLIIGILAAIAIPVFLGQQDKAKDSATKSDLANAKVFYVSNLVDQPTGSLGIAPFVQSSNSGAVTIQTPNSGSTFCLQATSQASTPVVFSIRHNGGIVTGGCP